MPESEINLVDAVSKMNPRLDENSFTHKQDQKEIQTRLDALFGNKKDT